jgi:hypothetical protein
MHALACFGKFPIKRRIVAARLCPQRLELLSTPTEIVVDHLPVRDIKSESAEDLFKAQDWKRFCDSLGRFSP